MPNESNSVPAVRPLREFVSPGTRELGEKLEGLFENKERLRLFVFLMRGYARRFETAQSLCMRLLGYKRVCYLVDFDVIRNYLEVKSLDTIDTFTVDFIFLDSASSFAIPVGAFEELLRYLASFSKSAVHLDKAIIEECDRIRATQMIADALGVGYGKTGDELIEEICVALDRSILALTRLLGLLTNPRFEGVKSQCSEECFHAWLDAIQKSRRARDPKPRSEVDRRDALNLAVASRNLIPKLTLINGKPQEESVCYLLVSQTRAVLQLVDDVRATEEIEDVRRFFDVDILVLRNVYPAVHPQDAMVVELLGGATNPTAALTRIQSRTLAFSQLANHLQNQYVWAVTTPERLYVDAFGAVVIQERREIQEELDKISRDMLAVQNELRLVEEARATNESEAQARQRQLGLELQPEDELRAKSLHFSRLLGEVAQALGTTPGADYCTQVQGPTETVPFGRFDIRPVTDVSCDIEPVVWGELYPGRRSNGDRETYEYFAVHWPITCLEEDLIRSLQNAWLLGCDDIDSGKLPSLIPIDDNHEYWKEGLVVSTSLGDYGMSLVTAACQGTWEWLELRRLGRLISLANPKIKSVGGRKVVPSILRLRINTLFADVLYDVRVAADMRRRFLTVISKHNITKQLVELYENTGSFLCDPTKLSEGLDTCLGVFLQCTDPT